MRDVIVKRWFCVQGKVRARCVKMMRDSVLSFFSVSEVDTTICYRLRMALFR